ncbi:MAG: hypothetical protein P8Y02_01480 [Deinococcales bacterium]
MANNGRIRRETVQDCLAFTILNNSTLKIAVEARGGGFKIITVDPDSGEVTLAVDGAPPDISDMDSREFNGAADSALGTGYIYVGERKTVWFSSLDPTKSEQDYIELARFNGERIDAVTSLGDNGVLVVLDTGEFRVLDVTDPANVTTTQGDALNTPALASVESCGGDRKSPQKYSIRWDPSGVLFATNLFCQTVSLFDEELKPLDPTAFDGLAVNTLGLGDVQPTGLDWAVGLAFDFADCVDPTLQFGCDIDKTINAARMFDVKYAGQGSQVVDVDTDGLMLKFDYLDCRWATDEAGNLLDCPIVNCPMRWPAWGDLDSCPEDDPKKQILDIWPLLSEFDETGLFDILAGPQQQMLLPGRIRGEELVPTVAPVDPNTPVECDASAVAAGTCVDNNYRMFTYFGFSDLIFVDAMERSTPACSSRRRRRSAARRNRMVCSSITRATATGPSTVPTAPPIGDP